MPHVVRIGTRSSALAHGPGAPGRRPPRRARRGLGAHRVHHHRGSHPRPAALGDRREGALHRRARGRPARRPHGLRGALAQGPAHRRSRRTDAWWRCSSARTRATRSWCGPAAPCARSTSCRRARAWARRACAAVRSCWRCAPTSTSRSCAATWAHGSARSTRGRWTPRCSRPRGSIASGSAIASCRCSIRRRGSRRRVRAPLPCRRAPTTCPCAPCSNSSTTPPRGARSPPSARCSRRSRADARCRSARRW